MKILIKEKIEVLTSLKEKKIKPKIRKWKYKLIFV